MTEYQPDPLLYAVEALTMERTIHTTITDDDGAWLRIHSEQHPPLLTMLIDGTGQSRNAGSADPGIPIDADALEMWGQVRDLIRLWSKQLGVAFDGDDLLGSVQRWHSRHDALVRSAGLSEEINRDVTRMVEGWVRMIEQKFDPPEKREWKDACPAWVRLPDGTQRRCGARRVVKNGEERFAINLNVTTLTAECSTCGEKWVGERGVAMLRYETNLWEMEKAEVEAARMSELERLAGDTPEKKVEEKSA